ncbi:SCO family protein [Sphingomonas flavalba]|uniref:SCO family protein n=1 Tax=Sphingomonas flavalba TaxID=2559804 RepID=UPI0039E128D4
MTSTDPAPVDPAPAAPPTGQLRRVRLLLWAAVLLAGLAGAVLYLIVERRTPSPADSYASAFGGRFTMTDQHGRTVTERTLRGKPYAIFFGFTRCPDVCPTSLSHMARLRQQLGAAGDGFNIVFVSVDPEHDRREDIGRYLEMFDTPIIGLTGNTAETERIVKAFHVYYAKVPVAGGSYTIDHTASIFLMDAQGRFVTTIDYHEAPDVALAKLRRIVPG